MKMSTKKGLDLLTRSSVKLLTKVRPRTKAGAPSEAMTAWRDLVGRHLAQWMRNVGWSSERYDKAAHELRKLFGSDVYTELGAEVAKEWLGHASITTTVQFYANLTRHPAPPKVIGIPGSS